MATLFLPTPIDDELAPLPVPVPTTAPVVDQAPRDGVPVFDPLDPSIDFEQPDERDYEQPGTPEKFQVAPLPELDTEQLAGGGFSVPSYAARNRIPEMHRKEGITICYVKADMSHWILQGGVRNIHWVRWRGGTFTGGPLAVIRGGNANPMNFAPEARWLTS
jgi:hypothetical protein